jgi:hypothetical protein
VLWIFLALVAAVVLIVLLNPDRWRRLRRGAEEGKRGFDDELDD